jgi:hypothetical protein
MTETPKPLAESDAVVLRPSGVARWFALGIGIAGLILSAVEIADRPTVGICTMAFFGLIALATIPQFWPRASYLKITSKGFEVRNVRQHFFVPWADVDEFFVRRVGKGKYVVFRLTESSSLKCKRSAMVRCLVPDDMDGLLPYTYGGFTREELASRLNLWRKNAVELDRQEQR